MAAVRTATIQGAPFSAWEALDTLFEQAFSRCMTFSPLAVSADITDRISTLPLSFPAHQSYHKSLPVPRHKEARRDSVSSSISSFSSDTSCEDYRRPPPSRSNAMPFIAPKAPKSSFPREPAPQQNAKPRVSRVRYSESSAATRSAIFSLPRVVNGDVHIGFTPGQLEVKWEYTKVRKVQQPGDQVVLKQKPKKYVKILPLPAGTVFSEIKATLTGRQLTITYPK